MPSIDSETELRQRQRKHVYSIFPFAVAHFYSARNNCDGWLVGGPKGELFSQLKRFKAYQDPIRKKDAFSLNWRQRESLMEWLIVAKIFGDGKHSCL